MASRTLLLGSIVLAVIFLTTNSGVEGRYLPTRSNGDRIDKLRELLKDLLESEVEKEESEPQRWRPDSKVFYKREVKMSEAPSKIHSAPHN